MGTSRWMDAAALQRAFDVLARRGRTLVGPTVRDGAIVYDRLRSTDDLPIGWTDQQGAGRYRLDRRADDAYFGFVVGPTSWKRFLVPPHQRLWSARRDAAGGPFEVTPASPPEEQYAFIGVRACDLHAIAVQDRVFLDAPYADETYRTLRERAFVVAVNCVEAHGTCFCASMETGPACGDGYDLALTEILTDGTHGFVVDVGTDRGAEVLDEVPHRPAADAEVRAATRAVERAAERMGRQLETEGIKELLYDAYEHPRWRAVAERCLACGNCTLVCPTCFCMSIRDVTNLAGTNAERRREWASCFSLDHSYIHGGSLRRSVLSRYRQWMTHKLATWIDQFGTSGCVGCGRCITWCPVGIDITDEAAAIRASDGVPAATRPQGGDGT